MPQDSVTSSGIRRFGLLAPASRRVLKRLYHAPALKGIVSGIPLARRLYPMEWADPIDDVLDASPALRTDE